MDWKLLIKRGWKIIKDVTSDDRLRDLDIHPSGEYLAFGNRENGDVYLYRITDPLNPVELPVSPLTEEDSQNRMVRFSTDGAYLTYSGSNTLYTHEVGGDWNLDMTFNATDQIRIARFDHEMKYMAYGDNAGNCFVYEVGGWTEITESPFTEPSTDGNRKYCRGISWSHHGQYLAYSDSKGNVYLRERGDDWEPLPTSPISESNDEIRFGLEFSPGDQYLCVPLSQSHKLDIHKVGDGWPRVAELDGATDAVKGADWNERHNFVAYTSDDSNIYIHEAEDPWSQINGSPLTDPGDDVRSGIRFSPDGQHLAVASDDGYVYIWEYNLHVGKQEDESGQWVLVSKTN